MFEVEWTGKWPCLCYGEWIIKKNGVDVSDVILDDKDSEPMYTFGEYESWYFDDSWNEEWDSFCDGMHMNEWIAHNEWTNLICESPEEFEELYDKINACDWRYGSCGGCI